MPLNNLSVFINCPFDTRYQSFFDRLVFTIGRCGYRPRCAQELGDGLGVRLHGIIEIMRDCRLSIHDLSRTDLDETNSLPRFNMPLELGVFVGARHFGDAEQQAKKALVLHTKQHEYKKFLSDFGGNDDPDNLIRTVRDYLNSDTVLRGQANLPGKKTLIRDFEVFEVMLAAVYESDGHDRNELGFFDYCEYLRQWLVTQGYACAISAPRTRSI